MFTFWIYRSVSIWVRIRSQYGWALTATMIQITPRNECHHWNLDLDDAINECHATITRIQITQQMIANSLTMILRTSQIEHMHCTVKSTWRAISVIRNYNRKRHSRFGWAMAMTARDVEKTTDKTCKTTRHRQKLAHEVLFLVVMRRDKTLGKMTHKEGPHSWRLFCDPSSWQTGGETKSWKMRGRMEKRPSVIFFLSFRQQKVTYALGLR